MTATGLIVVVVVGSSAVAVTLTSDFAPASSNESLDIQATIECGFALKRVRDMIRAYSHRSNCMLLSCHERVSGGTYTL